MRIFMGGVAALLAVVAMGCGSGSDTTQVALTKAQFIKRGDAICRAALKPDAQAVKTWFEENSKSGGAKEPDAEELGEAYVAFRLPPIKEALDELAALTPPGDVKAEKIVELLAAAVTTVEEEPRLMVERKPYRKGDLLAAAYGFKDCSLF